MSDAYLVTGTRPPTGRYAGGLAAVRPDDLATHVLRGPADRRPSVDRPASTTVRPAKRDLRPDPGVRVEARTADHRGGDLARDLSDLVKHNVGVTVRVDVVAPGALERSIGKAKRLVDNRSKG